MDFESGLIFVRVWVFCQKKKWISKSSSYIVNTRELAIWSIAMHSILYTQFSAFICRFSFSLLVIGYHMWNNFVKFK